MFGDDQPGWWKDACFFKWLATLAKWVNTTAEYNIDCNMTANWQTRQEVLYILYIYNSYTLPSHIAVATSNMIILL